MIQYNIIYMKNCVFISSRCSGLLVLSFIFIVTSQLQSQGWVVGVLSKSSYRDERPRKKIHPHLVFSRLKNRPPSRVSPAISDTHLHLFDKKRPASRDFRLKVDPHFLWKTKLLYFLMNNCPSIWPWIYILL